MKAYIMIVFLMPAFIILTESSAGDFNDVTAASLESNKPSTEKTDAYLAKLMTSMNIQRLAEPVMPPDFTLSSIADDQINLRQSRGNVVLLSFWATW